MAKNKNASDGNKGSSEKNIPVSGNKVNTTNNKVAEKVSNKLAENATPKKVDTAEVLPTNNEVIVDAPKDDLQKALEEGNFKLSVNEDESHDEKKKLTRAEKKALKHLEKEKYKQYHTTNVQILKNYRHYNEAERKHYRYIFGQRIMHVVWPVFRAFILVGLAFIILYPIIYMVSTAFRPQIEMNDPSIMWIPKTFTVQNIIDIWNAMNYPKVVFDTLIVNVVCSIIQVITCSIAGYGFARFKFKFKGLLFCVVILQIIVPTQIILIPQFAQFRYFDPLGLVTLFTGGSINLIDTPIALYLQAIFCNGIRAGLFILLFRQFFRGLPKELEDAAYLDGCGPLQTFVRIMIPNARSSYLTVFIFSLVWYWNDSYITGMFYSTNSTTIALQIEVLFYTISNYLNGEVTGVAADYVVWIEAGCLLSIVPILILYGFLQKQFIEGVERSGIVG